jgi:drug/metabolite transporter (DMT)-like permease
LGEVAALGTALCWATGSNFFMAAGRRMGSQTLNRLRISVAVLLLGSALWATRGAPWPLWATPVQVGFLALSGLVGFVFGDAFYFRALVILGAGRATLLAALAPVMTAVIARVFLGETLGLRAVGGIALTLGGLAWVLQGQARNEARHVEGSIGAGIAAGVLAALGQAVGLVLSKQGMQGGLDPLSATVIRVSAAVIGVWMLVPFQGGARRSLRALRDRTATRLMLGGAVFGPFLGVTLSLLAVAHTKTAIAAAIMACYPIPTILLASRFHREPITWRLASGAVVTLGGVVVLFGG